jgi:hypothetical protein
VSTFSVRDSIPFDANVSPLIYSRSFRERDSPVWPPMRTGNSILRISPDHVCERSRSLGPFDRFPSCFPDISPSGRFFSCPSDSLIGYSVCSVFLGIIFPSVPIGSRRLFPSLSHSCYVSAFATRTCTDPFITRTVSFMLTLF